MIVLDEQLASYGIQASIARWYRGTMTDITRLRPNTVSVIQVKQELQRIVGNPSVAVEPGEGLVKHGEKV